MKTKTQIQNSIVESHWNNGTWKFPCCGSEICSPPSVENKGEDYTQIYCPYGCGYVEIN